MTAGSVVAPQIIPIRVPLPGQAKHQIDTITPIEIKSDTPDVNIYYTLDGTKPEVLKKPGYGENSTLKYRGPVRLPEGKVTVKALAVTSNGKESAVVTKYFVVDYIQSNPLPSTEDDEHNFLKEYAKELSIQATMTIEGSSTHKSPKGPRFLNSRLGTPSHGQHPNPAPQTHRLQTAASVDSARKSLTSTQILRIQRETDFLRCAHCLAPRPSDPFARFCLECGSPVPPIPGKQLPPTEGGQVGLCVECKTMVPMNTSTCIVCEAPIAPQLQPQASIRLKDKIICRSCGTGNPLNLTHCVTCESRLSESQSSVFCGESAPPLLSSTGKMLSCSKCSRINTSNARFCDWCGAKTSDLQAAAAATWQPLSIPLPRPNAEQAGKVDQQTQTVGLFYPSGRILEKAAQDTIEKKEKQEQMRDRKPLATAVSPGRGYWRKQLDHICAHLRSYTQNNTEFRALIAEPRMGKPSPPVSYLTCSKCGASSHPYAHFCGSCGVYLEAPPRLDSPMGQANTSDLQAAAAATWQPLSIPLPRPNAEQAGKVDQQTQTVGLFYPSGRILEKAAQDTIEKKEKQEQMRDRKPLATAVSPGRGYWRKQLDHICAHLRSYTQNNTEFRALIAEPRMGKMISAVVHEDNYEVSLRINFVLAEDKNGLTGKPHKLLENNYLSSVTEGRSNLYSSHTSLASENSAEGAGVGKKNKKIKKKRKVLEREDKLPPEDRQLLKEVGPGGKGRISTVQQLLEEGADPNCLTNDSRPALTVAVLNKHHEVIPVLVQTGADTDQQSGICNASIRKKNDKGFTAYDLAVKTGCEPLISLFAAKMGQGMLDKLSKPRNVNLDGF
ncbi:Double zinc ribbon and ankyrin repeat-containing protein 1 [Acipenser ruthenus]|uniref:Double zinc ribbon and ankyrin repeat-containing protein 1 n=1 Tax=Acipenser ruthenus TaxID=7906 RepID=A0A444UER0_ACIRT|nr:Double zinc ribbon and ankyrin repeat-containing protein 1 [Acipenser ruthenus]